MAYMSKDLSVLAYANGFTAWHYTTADTASQIAAPGYFNASLNMFRAGDEITANVNTTGKIGLVRLLVSGNSHGVVTVEVVGSTQAAALIIQEERFEP